MQTDDGKVVSITAARKNRLRPEEDDSAGQIPSNPTGQSSSDPGDQVPESDKTPEADDLCWQCLCGCVHFLLCNKGRVRCLGCGMVNSIMWGFTADEEGPGAA